MERDFRASCRCPEPPANVQLHPNVLSASIWAAAASVLTPVSKHGSDTRTLLQQTRSFLGPSGLNIILHKHTLCGSQHGDVG